MKLPRRGLKFLGWTLGLGFLITLTPLISIYFILRSEAMQQRILASIQEPLAKAGLVTEIDRLSIDLLGGVSLDGLNLKIEKAPLARGQIRLEKLRLGYAIWPLLQRRLEISELSLEGIEGQLELELAETPPVAEEAPPPDFGALLDLLRRPPLALDGPELSIRRLNLGLTLRKGPLELKSQLRETSLITAIEVQPGLVQARLDLDLGTEVDLLMRGETGGSPALELQTGVKLRLNPEIRLELKGEAPEETLSWKLAWPELFVALSELKLAQRGPDGALIEIAWPTMEFQQETTLEHSATLPSQPELDDLIWPLEIGLDQQLSGAPLDFKQSQGKTETLAASVTPGLKTKTELKLPTLATLSEAAWTLEQTISLADLHLRQAGKSLVATQQLGLHSEGRGEKGEGKIETSLRSSGLHTPFVKGPLALDQKISAELALAQRTLHLEGATRLNSYDLLSFALDAADPEDKELQTKLQLKVKTDPILQSLHEGLAALEKVGFPHLELSLASTLKHPMPIQQIDASSLAKLTITNSLDIKANQSKANAQTLARFNELRLQQEGSWQNEIVKTKLKIELDQLKHAALLRPVDLRQELQLEGARAAFLKGELSAETFLGGHELLSLNAALEDLPQKALLKSDLKVQVRPELQKEVEALKILNDTGPLLIKGEQTVTLKHGAASLQEVKDFDPKKLTIDALLKQVISAAGKKPSSKYRLLEPLSIESRAQLVKGKGDLTTRILAKDLEAQDLARVKDLRVGVMAKLSDLETQRLVEAKVVAQVGRVDPLGELGQKPELQGLLQQLQLVLDAQVERKEKLTIRNLYAGLRHPLLHFRGKGQFLLAGRGSFDGRLEVNMPQEPIAGLKGKGRFRLPLRLTAYDQKKISIRAEPEFQAFTAELGDLAMRNAQGSVQIHEELSLDEAGKIGFLYLNTQNPFVRVDYDSVEPYVGDQALLSIEELRHKHVTLGPMVMNFEVQQNLIYLNDFKADLLKGSALGRLYFDLHPDRLQLGFLGRFSNLQPELLKEPERRSASAVKDAAVLSGRMGTSFDMRQRLALGRIDLTSIGRRQLASLLDVLDPNYKDDQIGMARRAIQVAYPERVTISMNQGLMDLTIALGGAVSKDINIRSIPLTAFINANLGPALEKVQALVREGEEEP